MKKTAPVKGCRRKTLLCRNDRDPRKSPQNEKNVFKMKGSGGWTVSARDLRDPV